MDFFRDIGPIQIGIILLIILIVFGVGKLPQVGGAIGKSIHEFRKATQGETSQDKHVELKAADAKPNTVTNEQPENKA